ncbi:GPW/gp25 family protein [Sphingosinicella terrae]|uniref:GPW/gp25 family protein n=1 Tax=Sphingosinicella terrae TaxID=2172047 RepID=UPI000E0D93B4|nr:GPW/gp25 family protein [Sphingosinicella terrae]
MTLAPFARRLATPLSFNPLSGRTEEEPDYDAYVRQLIRFLLLTSPGERVNRPAFGAGIRRLVFAPLSEATAMLARTMVYDSLTRWLQPIIQVEQVKMDVQAETLLVTVVYRVIAHGEQRYLNEEVRLS